MSRDPERQRPADYGGLAYRLKSSICARQLNLVFGPNGAPHCFPAREWVAVERRDQHLGESPEALLTVFVASRKLVLSRHPQTSAQSKESPARLKMLEVGLGVSVDAVRLKCSSHGSGCLFRLDSRFGRFLWIAAESGPQPEGARTPRF